MRDCLVPVTAPGDPVADGPAPRGRGAAGDGPADVDAWLVSHAAAGDLQAFETLVERHQRLVYRVAHRLLGNAQDAEDTTQDVWVQVWSSLGSLRGSAAFTTWLYRVTVNKSLSLTRRRYRALERPAPGDGSPADPLERNSPPAASSEDTAVAGERSRAVAAAVARLPEDLRVVFVLRHFEDLSYNQLADVLGLPVATVRGRLARSRQQLVTVLKEWR